MENLRMGCKANKLTEKRKPAPVGLEAIMGALGEGVRHYMGPSSPRGADGHRPVKRGIRQGTFKWEGKHTGNQCRLGGVGGRAPTNVKLHKKGGLEKRNQVLKGTMELAFIMGEEKKGPRISPRNRPLERTVA